MIVYNVTVKIDEPIAADWLAWTREEHIPTVMATGCFTAYRLLRIDDDEPEVDGVTFAVQYTCQSREIFRRYVAEYAGELQRRHRERYDNRFIAIRTLMTVVAEQVVYGSDS